MTDHVDRETSLSRVQISYALTQYFKGVTLVYLSEIIILRMVWVEKVQSIENK